MGEADNQPLISVIVPVYNVEAYLRDCVDSIIAQTYTNLEIILVDDGSPDGCPGICDEYAQKDSRIRVIHKENGGLSNARNAGMEFMSGEYLMFIDSDDVLPKNSVRILYNLAVEHSAELVIGRHIRFSEDDELRVSESSSHSVQCFDKTEAMQDMFRNGCASWGRLYRSDIHKNILFPVGEINEDEAIVLDILERCETVVKTEECVYFYRYRPDSITTAEFNPQKLIWVKHCQDNLEWIREYHPELVPEAAARYRGSLMWSLTEMALSDADFKIDIQRMLTELKTNRKLFLKHPFQYRQDKIRLWMLMCLPFDIYKNFIRIKRRG